MKRLFLLFLLAFFCAINIDLKAQPTLTAANTNVVVGEQFISNHLSGSAAPFNAGLLAGANFTWNFSNLTSPFYPTISVLFQPHLPIGSNPYPTANVVIGCDGEYEYLKANTDSIVLVGYYDNFTEETVDYSNSVKKLQYPFTYNSSFTDNFAGVGDGMGLPTPISGNVNVLADGYGTLILPSGTVTNTLRVKTIKNSTASNAYNTFIDTTTTLDWYLTGIHVPVLRILKQKVYIYFNSTYQGTLSYYDGYYIDPNALGVKEKPLLENNLQTFPNPATSEVTLQYALKSSSKASLVLTDALGREVIRQEQEKQPAGNISENLDISKLPKGVYLLRLETQEGVSVKRLLIQ